MTPPPVRPSLEAVEERRNPVGWILLALLFGVTLYLALSNSLRRPEGGSRYEVSQNALRTALGMRDLAAFGGANASETAQESVAADRDRSPLAAAIWTAAEFERTGKAVPREKLPKALAPAVRQVYTGPKPTQAQAQRLATRLPKEPFVYRLVAAHAAERAGDPGPKDRLVPQRGGAMLAVVGLFLLMGLASLGGLVTFVTLAASRQISPAGSPQSPISLAQADRLALRAAQVFALFIGIGILVGLVGERRFTSYVGTVLQGALMIVGVVLLTLVPVNGRRISLSSLGVSRHRLGKHVLIGLAALVVELPLALLVGALGQRLFSFLPEPNHPAGEAIAMGSPATVAATLFAAAVVAPFWEEIMFRGLLFPALSRVAGGVAWGTFLSSLLFAAIHPQGIALWLALGTVGAVSCVVAHYTRSLVPSIVLHAAHNATLLGVAITLYR